MKRLGLRLRNLIGVIGVLAAVVAPAAAGEQVYDANRDFDASLDPPGPGGTNPNGVWTYSFSRGLATAPQRLFRFTVLDDPAPINCNAEAIWIRPEIDLGWAPSVAKTIYGPCKDGNVDFEMNELILHPIGNEMVGFDGYAHVVFTAPENRAEAEALHRETLGIQTRVLGPEHPNTAKSMYGVAIALRNQERYAEAEALHRQVLEIRTRVLGPEHQDTLRSRIALVTAWARCSGFGKCGLDPTARGRWAEIEAFQRETLGIQTRALGLEHPDTLDSRMNLALTIGAQGRYADAEALYGETLGIQTRVLGPDHPKTVLSLYNLASTTAVQGKRAEALSLLRDAVGRGFPDPDDMEQESNLSTLRGDPEFQKLVTAARENQRRQRLEPPAAGR